MSSHCCGGVPTVNIDGRWSCSECGATQPESQLDFSDALIYGFDYATTRNYNDKVCECGAVKTSNPNCHSTWCPLYKKD